MAYTSKKANKSKAALYKWVVMAAVGGGFFALLVYALVFKDEIRTTELDVPLISAPDVPVKRRPDQPGGMDIPNRDKLVFDLLAPETRGEEPAPVKVAGDTADEKVAAAEVKPVEAPKKAQIKPEVKPEPAPAPKPAKQKMDDQAQLAALAAEATTEEVAAPKVEPKQTPKPAAVQQGDWGVQLASFVNKADAERALNNLQSKHTGLLGSLAQRVQRVELSQGKGVRYRAQFFGYANKQEAAKLCSSLKSKGQDCLRVKR